VTVLGVDDQEHRNAAQCQANNSRASSHNGKCRETGRRQHQVHHSIPTTKYGVRNQTSYREGNDASDVARANIFRHLSAQHTRFSAETNVETEASLRK
jgi:hypothetical protein